MQVRHLTYFVSLAREKHFARAAEACHITQPTLSAAINTPEEDLKIRLVVREHRFIGLTPEGEKVLHWAQQILSDYDNLRSDLGGLRRGLRGTLRLGVIPAAMPSVSLLTDRFCAAHPSAAIEIHSLHGKTLQPEGKTRVPHPPTTSSVTPADLDITPRMFDVLQLALQGHPTKKIALILDINDSNMRRYLSRLYARVGVTSVKGLLAHFALTGRMKNIIGSPENRAAE